MGNRAAAMGGALLIRRVQRVALARRYRRRLSLPITDISAAGRRAAVQVPWRRSLLQHRNEPGPKQGTERILFPPGRLLAEQADEQAERARNSLTRVELLIELRRRGGPSRAIGRPGRPSRHPPLGGELAQSTGSERGFGPRGKAPSICAMSWAVSTISPAPAFSSICDGVPALGMVKTAGSRTRKASAT